MNGRQISTAEAPAARRRGIRRRGVGGVPAGLAAARAAAEAGASVLVAEAKRDIGARIRATAPGRATIVLATEIDEALEIADRILVMSEGTVVGEHVNRGIDLGRLMAQVVDAPGARAVTAE